MIMGFKGVLLSVTSPWDKDIAGIAKVSEVKIGWLILWNCCHLYIYEIQFAGQISLD